MGFGDVNTNSGANATYKFYTQILPLIIGPLQGLCPSVTPGGGEGNGEEGRWVLGFARVAPLGATRTPGSMWHNCDLLML